MLWELIITFLMEQSSLPQAWSGMNTGLAHSGSPLTPNLRPCLRPAQPGRITAHGWGPEPSSAQFPVRVGHFYNMLGHQQGEG